MEKGKYFLGAFLTLVVLTSSVYLILPDDFKILIGKTNTKYYVWDEGGWDLAATEYVNIYDGTTKMRASSREIKIEVDDGEAIISRISTWKDGIVTTQKYYFDGDIEDITKFPFKNTFECLNCQGKVVHYEIRDISYRGITREIESPFDFGKNMKIVFQKDYLWAKVYQQKVASDKIIVRYKPKKSRETYNVRLFDPPALDVRLDSPANNSLSGSNQINFSTSINTTNTDTVVNISFWTNSSGLWEVNQSRVLDLNDTDLNTYAHNGFNHRIESTINFENSIQITNWSAWVRHSGSGNSNYWQQFNLSNGTLVNSTKFNTALTSYQLIYFEIPSTDARVVSVDLFATGSGGTSTANLKNSTWKYNSSLATGNFTIYTGEAVLWNIESCDSSGFCTLADDNYTVFIDNLVPLITIHYPLDTDYLINVDQINYTVQEDNPSACWYSFDSGTTIENQTESGTNFTNVSSVLWKNNITFYCNDTFNQIGAAHRSYNLLPFDYSPNSNKTNASFGSIEDTYINVTINPIITFKNITYRGYNLTTGSIVLNISQGYTSTRTNDTLPSVSNPFYWDVKLVDSSDVEYLLPKRYYGEEIVNVSLENGSVNILVELGTSIRLNASSNIYNVNIDVLHPEYGMNAFSGFLNVSGDIIINYFRKNFFNDSALSKILDYSGTEIKEVYFPAHQYDEVDSMEFNITGVKNITYPENVQINNSNISVIDRFYPGFLQGNGVYQNKDFEENTNKTLTYSNAGTRTLNFYMDDAGDLLRMTFEIRGFEFGVEFLDSFANFSDVDQILTDAQLDKSGSIMSANASLTEFLFDDFDDSSIAIIWEKTPDISSTVGNYNLEGSISEAAGQITISNVIANGGDVSSATNTMDLGPNKTYFDLFSSENILMNLSNTYNSEADNAGCSGSTALFLGGTNVWENMFLVDQDTGSNQIETSQADLILNLSKHNSTSWRVQISGIETSSVFMTTGSGHCGAEVRTNNWTNGTYVHTRDSCADINGVLNNDSFQPVTYNVNNAFIIRNQITMDQAECQDNNMQTELFYVNHSRWSRSNSTAISKSIYDSTGDIASATLNVSGFTAPNETTSFYLSANGGDNWEPVTLGLLHSFTFPGTSLKWKVDFNITYPGFVNVSSYVESVNITTPKGFPQDITVDFSDDGITDFSFAGELNTTQGSVIVNVSLANLTGSLNQTPIIGNHLMIIPLKIFSNSVGQIDLDNINFTYLPNPISLNSSSILNFISNSTDFVDFPISIESTGGNISIDDIKYDYAGGNQTFEILTHNDDYSKNNTLNITYYYSRWDFTWGPSNVDFLYFAPANTQSKNVTPYGQSDKISILNITNYGYGGKNANLSIYQDGTAVCTNTTMSLDKYKENGTLINASFRNLADLSYLETVEIFMWADYQCSINTWRLFEPQLYFRQCVESGVCSEEII